MDDYDDADIDAIEALHSCRCCLRRPPDKGLKTLYTHLGKTEIYSDMLEECFDIRIRMESNDECGICEVCVSRLRDATEFRQQVQRSQTELQRLQFMHFMGTSDKEQIGHGSLNSFQSSQSKKQDDKPSVKSELDDDAANNDFVLRASDDEEVETTDSRSQCSNTKKQGEVKLEAKMSEGEAITAEELKSPPSTNTTSASESAPTHALEQLDKATTCAATTPPPRPEYRDQATEPIPSDMLQTQTKDKSLALKNNPRKTEKRYTCEICKKQFDLKPVLRRHLQIHSMERFSCTVCDKLFTYQHNLKRHMRVHTGEKPFACDVCNERFKKKLTLKTHLTKYGHFLQIFCKICKKRFAAETELNEHILRLHGITQTNAQQSKGQPKEKQPKEPKLKKQKSTKDPTQQRQKKESTPADKIFCCELCGRQFKYKKLFITHMNKHMGVKPEVCECCNRRFLDKNTLKCHMLIHTGEKPFPCEICQKRFRQSSTLQDHMLIHKGIKKYTCDACNKQFRHKSALKVHTQRTHLGQKPHSCDICNKTFVVLAALKLHYHVHTGGKPYVCEVCHMKFSLPSTVRRHLKRIHGEKTSKYSVIKQ